MKKFKNLYPRPEGTKRYRMISWVSYTLNNEPWINQKSKSCNHFSIDDFETRQEMNESRDLLEALYKDTPRPKVYEDGIFWSYSEEKILFDGTRPDRKWWSPHSDAYRKLQGSKDLRLYNASWTDYQGGEARYWGYALLDYEKSEIIGIYHDSFGVFNKKNCKKSPSLKDELFRDPTEIPEDYQWEPGEYQGWLQYRWGDGQNAIAIEDARREKKKAKEGQIWSYKDIFYEDEIPDDLLQESEYDHIQDQFNDKLVKETEDRLMDRW